MNDCIKNSARVDDKLNMLCLWNELYGRRRISLGLPSMMPGFRYANPSITMDTKGEICFYLNAGNGHTPPPHKVLLASGVAS